ncbi:ATP-binding protein [Arachidicoccus ginsenosidivorans]|jgi:AAA15 family ATPase/GTPase|uniref:AAA family ATPase n=1 Tax=Arachidicoccus ginsenosidivorans TaxID=496057 RepID=A0A5B8VM66_9BACT|nr:AAA family ATPase [Arachidicoccus ginsenosidivorans]
MLIEFNVENFLSFKDLTTLSMVAAKSFKEHELSNLIQPEKVDFRLLKSTIIYGNNASGKSNLLEAMGFMKSMVLNSFKEALNGNKDKKFPLKKFALNSKSEKESSFFEILFIQNGTRYRYGFELDYDSVVAEWLFHTTSKEVYLFRRDGQKFEINKSAFKEGLGKEEDVKENVLFLSFLSFYEKSNISNRIIAWFDDFNFVNGVHDGGHKRYTLEKLSSDKQFFNWALHFLKFLEISNISNDRALKELELKKNQGKDDGELVNKILSNFHTLTSSEKLVTYHRKFDEHNVLVDTVPFNFDLQESEGTKKLLYLLGPCYDTLRNGRILVVDELDSRFHPHLTLRLLNLFHFFNLNGAQLICAVHDISLLNKDTFRRDQIWFVEKNQFGATQLYSLGDFKTDKVRNKTAFDKNYMEGKYGAVPYFEKDEQLKKMLYEKREAGEV